jgi:hypothetical protein
VSSSSRRPSHTDSALRRTRTPPPVADITGLLDLTSWPAGMRVIVRKGRPHPGAQLRFTGIDGHRSTVFVTDARRGPLADLELRHRRRARCEDRIRCAKDTGLRNLLLKGFAQSQLWDEIVTLACKFLAWTRRSPACRPCPPTDQPQQPLRPGRKHQGPVEPRPPGATTGQSATAGT